MFSIMACSLIFEKYIPCLVACVCCYLSSLGLFCHNDWNEMRVKFISLSVVPLCLNDHYRICYCIEIVLLLGVVILSIRYVLSDSIVLAITLFASSFSCIVCVVRRVRL